MKEESDVVLDSVGLEIIGEDKSFEEETIGLTGVEDGVTQVLDTTEDRPEVLDSNGLLWLLNFTDKEETVGLMGVD